ncbi:MAG TPA: NYN domain-containing protein [Phycisphaerales bacterium]|nr:NYN domain-containing protein [Phycisphaerales bacterium]HMP38290.1 NYN domain-containing protein [Phycisphaerales bacterium]
MPLIVDTYNVLHVTGVLPPALAGLDVDRLAVLIAQSRYRWETTWLVCDGARPAAWRARGGSWGSRGRGAAEGSDSRGGARSSSGAGQEPRSGGAARSDDGEGDAAPAGAARSDRRATMRGRIVTHYAGPGREADECIGRMIDASTHPRRLTVVSSDRQVQRMARRRRCTTVASETFLALLAEDHHAAARASTGSRAAFPAQSIPLDRRQVNRWIDLFGLQGDWLEIPASAAPQAPAEDPRAPRGEPAADLAPRRPLEGVTSLDQIDPAELDRFDMAEWLGVVPPPSGPKEGRGDR